MSRRRLLVCQYISTGVFSDEIAICTIIICKI